MWQVSGYWLAACADGEGAGSERAAAVGASYVLRLE